MNVEAIYGHVQLDEPKQVLAVWSELWDGDWETNNWIGVYFSIPDPDSPGNYQTSMTVVQYNNSQGYASERWQGNYYGTHAWEDDSWGNFTTLDVLNIDPFGPWIAGSDMADEFPSSRNKPAGQRWQEFLIFRFLEEDM